MSLEELADREIDRLNDQIDDLVARNRVLDKRLGLIRDLADMAQCAADRHLSHRPAAKVSVEEVLYIVNGGSDHD
jgi:hypothetical protein